jgi:hypothetical protein
MQAFGLSQYLLQKGFGREDEIFEELVKKFPEYYMLLGTSMDDYKGFSDYQFFNDKILTNSIVNLGISTDLNLDVYTNHGMKETDINFEITKLSKNGHIIQEINNKPALPELSRLLNWPENYITEKNLLKTSIYYPISLRRHSREVPAVMAFILKDNIMTPCVIDKGEVSILTVSGKNLLNAMKENLERYRRIKPEFGFCSTCMTILATLGYNTDKLRREMLDYFKEKPFLMYYCAGEGTYSPTRKITYANMSLNTAIFGYNNENLNPV